MKVALVTLAFLAIVASLIVAGVMMLRGSSGPGRAGTMARALAVRVGLSIALFVCILAAYLLGWIHPTGVPL